MTDPLDRVYDQLLVVRCQAGDAAAFAELVARYSPRLRYFLRTLAGRAEVEDLLQQVWLDAFRGLPRLADPAAFPAWAYRIARGRAARLFRRRAADPGPLPDVPDDPGEPFTADDAAAVHAALAELGPDHREVLVLRFLDDLSYDDIARVVGVPVGTVRSRLHLAKKALRVILERRAGDG
jgi:RNA polymerase sigma-70 factor (ECF subfamily)